MAVKVTLKADAPLGTIYSPSHPKAAPCLALGQNVLLALGDATYEIHE